MENYSSETGPFAPCLTLRDQTEVKNVVRDIILKWGGNFGPNLILSLISDSPKVEIPQESEKSLIDGFLNIFQSTSTWVVTSDNGVLLQAADKALKLMREEQSYMKDHPDFSHHDEKVSYRPDTNSLILCVTTKAEAENVITTASNFIFLDGEAVACEDVQGVRNELVDNLWRTPFESRVMREISVSEAKHSVGVLRAEHRIPKNLNSRTPFATLYAGNSIRSLHALSKDLLLGVPVILFQNSSPLSEVLDECLEQYYSCKIDHKSLVNNLKLVLPRTLSTAGKRMMIGSDEIDQAVTLIVTILRYSIQREKLMIHCEEAKKLLEKKSNLIRSVLNALTAHATTSWIENRLFPLYVHCNQPILAKEANVSRSFLKSDLALRYFMEALRYPEREDMVAYFLEENFQIGEFLTPALFWELFTTMECQRFFETVILGRLLGYSLYPTNREIFLSHRLPKLLETLTGIEDLFDEKILKGIESQTSKNPVDSLLHRSADFMAFWSMLMNRGSLAKQFAAYSAEPLPLALILSKMSSSLAEETRDIHFHEESMRKLSMDFAAMAHELLNESYSTSPHRSYDALCRPFPQFGGLTATQIALQAGNKPFIAHRSCQMWVSRRLFGPLQLTNLTSFPLPTWIKVLICSIFVFPMKFWLRYTLTDEDSHEHGTKAAKANFFVAMHSTPSWKGSKQSLKAKNKGTEVEMKSLMKEESNSKNAKTENIDSTDGLEDSLKFIMEPVERELSIEPPKSVFEIARIFYHTPITKYWLSLMFKLIHLLLFGYSLSLPGCGCLIWDSVVWIWALVAWLEAVYVYYQKKRNLHLHRLAWETTDIIVVGCFLVVSAVLKLTTAHFYISSFGNHPFAGRCVMSLFFLYLCYSTLFIYIPMSETLGPLLVRIKLMILRDLINFLTLTSIIIVASGIVVHTIVFPDFPEGKKLWHQALHWAGFSLFTSDLSYLKETAPCRQSWFTIGNASTSTAHENQCHRTSGYSDPKCPKQSSAAYFAVVQYFVILKLICWPLLFALFGKTAKEVDDEADSIWKHQLYCLVTDFGLRPAVPTPLSLFYVPVCWMISLCRKCGKLVKKSQDPNDQMDSVGISFGKVATPQRPKDPQYHSYWRALAQGHWRKSLAPFTLAPSATKSFETPSVQTLMQSRSGPVGIAEKPYGQNRVLRLSVDKELGEFQTLLPQYAPLNYSKGIEQFSRDLRVLADSSKEWAIPMISWEDRESIAEIQYDIAPGNYPLNPSGRQGLAGRGDLPRFGPNYLCAFIITNKVGDKTLVCDEDFLYPGNCGIPKSYVAHPIAISEDKRLTALHYTLGISSANDTAPELTKFELSIVKKLESELDTDNAWLELALFKVAMKEEQEFEKMEWKSTNEIESPDESELCELDQEIVKLGKT